jgi:hypothetical protein
VLALSLCYATNAEAATYRVGPGKPYAHPSEVARSLKPGDVVEIDGNATYSGGTAFRNHGSATGKITIRGIVLNNRRPVLSGGSNTVEAAGDHYVFENLEITGGSARCFYHHAHDVTLKTALIRDCPQQGVLGAQADSGSLFMEHVEVTRCGAGLYDHQIYMDTDESTHPDAVFRMQHCYVHDGNGGNNVKSRAARNEIYSNWISGALYHELELIGPASAGRKDSDIVGNVLFKTRTSYVARLGGDADASGSRGRYRFVNNTVVVQAGGAAVFRLFAELESVEMHNNLFTAAGGGRVDLLRDMEASWSAGRRVVSGSRNWVRSGGSNVPHEWTGTITGDDPGFVDFARGDLRLAPNSPLIDRGSDSPLGHAGYQFPSPLVRPTFEPILSLLWPQWAQLRARAGQIDVGAFEFSATSGAGSAGGASGLPPPNCSAARAGGSASPGYVGLATLAFTCGMLRRRRRMNLFSS